MEKYKLVKDIRLGQTVLQGQIKTKEEWKRLFDFLDDSCFELSWFELVE